MPLVRILVMLFFAALPAAVSLADAAPRSCLPSVRLEGDADTVAPVAEALAAEGVTVDGAPECMRVVARVRRDGGTIELRLADVHGRVALRRLSDPATAAALIEAWARPELAGTELDELPPRATEWAVPVPEAPAASTQGGGGAGTVAAPDPSASSRAERARPFGLGLWVGSARGSDATVWGDLGVSACLHAGPLCVGGTVRADLDFGERGRSRTLDTDRSALALMATGELPVLVERAWSFTPGFGLGAAVVQNEVDGDPPRIIVPHGPVRRTDVNLRVAASLKLGLRIRARLYATVLMAMELVPLGRTAAEHDADGVQVAGNPRWLGRLAIGLAYDRY